MCTRYVLYRALVLRQCVFYGLDNDLQTGLVFYGHDLSEYGTDLLWTDWTCTFSCGRDDVLFLDLASRDARI